MLTHLSIKGLAIIDELSIDFTKGFNVITGETGAGKSILIKALNLLLGSKTNSDVVRKGSPNAVVCGTFLISKNHPVVSLVEELGILADSENGNCELLIRRSVNSKGRSSAWVNDTPVTVTSMKNIGSGLIDVFGQHENTKILDPNRHTFYLDQFLKTKSLPASVKQVYKNCMTILRDLRETIKTFEEGQRSQDYTRYRYEELRALDPSQEDYDAIQASCKDAGRSQIVKEQLSETQHLIDRGASGASLSSLVWGVSSSLEKLSENKKDSYGELSAQAKDIAIGLDDLSFGIDRANSGLNFDESALEEDQLRLSKYQEFFRKLGFFDLNSLLDETERLRTELEFIDSAAQAILTKISTLYGLLNELSIQSCKLSQQRLKAKIEVKKRVEAEFEDLAMPGAKFDVHFQKVSGSIAELNLAGFGPEAQQKWAEVCEIMCEYGEYGAEKANFMLSSNPGEPSLPLQKIASGGEVSRIMLALKKSLAAGANTCILVFDEIDSGISGRVASMVGKKMHELSKNFQIVCISHLPQVAAFSDSHFLVHKFGNRKRTESTITLLSKSESTKEIARLLSGDKVNKLSLANAQSMIETASHS